MLPGVASREFRAELHALRLATAQLRRRLAEPDVSEPDILERVQPAVDPRLMLEEHRGLVDRHLEHVGDALAAELHLERLAVVATPLAHLARHVDVREKVHLDLDHPVARARLAATA